MGGRGVNDRVYVLFNEANEGASLEGEAFTLIARHGGYIMLGATGIDKSLLTFAGGR